MEDFAGSKSLSRRAGWVPSAAAFDDLYDMDWALDWSQKDFDYSRSGVAAESYGYRAAPCLDEEEAEPQWDGGGYTPSLNGRGVPHALAARSGGSGGAKPRVNPGGGLVPSVNGNSHASKRATHVYEIMVTIGGNTFRHKYGISSGRINARGKSYRAEAQLRAIEARYGNGAKAKSNIVMHCKDRADGVLWEKNFVNYDRHFGPALPGNLRP